MQNLLTRGLQLKRYISNSKMFYLGTPLSLIFCLKRNITVGVNDLTTSSKFNEVHKLIYKNFNNKNLKKLNLTHKGNLFILCVPSESSLKQKNNKC